MKKMTLFILFLFFEIVTSCRNFFVLPKFHNFNGFNLKVKRVFLLKNCRRTRDKKIINFSFIMKIVSSRRNFFVFTKISYLQRFRFKIKPVFPLKFRREPKKILFSDFFCHQDESFSFLPNFLIFNGFYLKKNVIFG